MRDSAPQRLFGNMTCDVMYGYIPAQSPFHAHGESNICLDQDFWLIVVWITVAKDSQEVTL